MKKFNYSDVPLGYKLCFNEHCPKHDDCIRFFAGQHLPATVMSGAAIYPNAISGDICPYYKKTRVIHGAWGFRNLYKGVELKDLQVIRPKVINYLGGPAAFYGYTHGDRLLTPEQQETIRGFFLERGYTKELVFEGYTLIYDFTD